MLSAIASFEENEWAMVGGNRVPVASKRIRSMLTPFELILFAGFDSFVAN